METPDGTQVWIGEQVGDRRARRGSLAELVPPLQNVSPSRTVRTVWPATSELAVIVAAVAVGAQNLDTHHPPLRDPVKVQHVTEQAGLRQRAAAGVSNRVA